MTAPARPASTSAPESAALLSSVVVSPESLANALVLFTTFALNHGLTEDELSEVALFLDDNGLTLATDLDRDTTRCTDGAARPFRLRFRLPPLVEARGAAARAGAVIHTQQLLAALRRRAVGSATFGVLGNETPVAIELYAPASRADDPTVAPTLLVVRPIGEAAPPPRRFRVLRGVSTAELSDWEPVAVGGMMPDLDTEVLIEAAGVAHPDVGIVVDAAPLDGQAPYVAAVGPMGAMVGAFRARIPLGAEVPDGALPWNAPVVVSPRWAECTGIAQDALEEAVKEAQRAQTKQHERNILIAALAAAVETGGPHGGPAGGLAWFLGQPLAAKALAAAHKAAQPAARAVAYAHRLLDGLDGPARADVVRALTGMFPPADPVVGQSAPDGEEAAVAAALATLPTLDDRLQQIAAVAVGTALLKSRMGPSQPASPAEWGLRAAAAAGSLYDGKLATMLDPVLALVPQQEVGAWWTAYEGALGALEVPRNAIAFLLKQKPAALAPADAPPSASALKVSQAVKDEWMAASTAPVRGCFWRTPDGRVYAGYDHPAFGRFMLSDRAVRPDPWSHPVQASDVRMSQAKGHDITWRAEFFSEDLARAGNAVIGLTNLSRGRQSRARPHPTRPVSSGTLFVARWTPSDGPDPVAPLLPLAARAAQPIDAVQIGEGAAAERFIEGRGGKRQLVEGAVTVYGFEAGGERVVLRVPLKAAPAALERPLAFALDAERLRNFVGFIVRKSGQATLEVVGGVVRLTTLDKSRTVVLPTVGATQVPEVLQPLLAAAGISALPTRVPMGAVIERVRQAAAAAPQHPEQALPTRAPLGRRSDQPAVVRRAGVAGSLVSEELFQARVIHKLTRLVAVRDPVASQERVRRWLGDIRDDQARRIAVVVAFAAERLAHAEARAREVAPADAAERAAGPQGGVLVAADLQLGFDLGMAFVPEPLSERAADAFAAAQRAEVRRYRREAKRQVALWAGVVGVAREVAQSLEASVRPRLEDGPGALTGYSLDLLPPPVSVTPGRGATRAER